jgi:hypothetical protein
MEHAFISGFTAFGSVGCALTVTSLDDPRIHLLVLTPAHRINVITPFAKLAASALKF